MLWGFKIILALKSRRQIHRYLLEQYVIRHQKARHISIAKLVALLWLVNQVLICVETFLWPSCVGCLVSDGNKSLLTENIMTQNRQGRVCLVVHFTCGHSINALQFLFDEHVDQFLGRSGKTGHQVLFLFKKIHLLIFVDEGVD